MINHLMVLLGKCYYDEMSKGESEQAGKPQGYDADLTPSKGERKGRLVGES